MQVNAGLFIETLREGLEKLTDDGVEYTAGDVLALFDRASVKALVAQHNGSGVTELTPAQRGARTRAKNRAAKAGKGGDASHDFGGGTEFNPPKDGGQ